jgi:hypothetical protein
MKEFAAIQPEFFPALVLCSKYQRALEIKSMYSALRQSMWELSMQSRDEFETWREKEKAHLCSLSKEPKQETLEMEYFQKLVNLRDTKYVPLPSFYLAIHSFLTHTPRERVATILRVEQPFVPAENEADYAQAVKATQRIETQCRHALELQVKALAAVHDLED